MTQPRIASRLRPFGTTIFAEMTKLALDHNAVNLSQGFPDFDGPDILKTAAGQAMRDGRNQYARPYGEIPLVEAIAADRAARTGHAHDPMSEVTVTSGCTEALAAISLGLLEPGDEVVLFEPYYDSYRAVVALAGATPRFVGLREPDADHDEFWFDPHELERAFTDKTRALFLNTPNNPTGKVFTRDELGLIAALAIERDVFVVSDEVYEHLVFEADRPHISIATLPGMRERTIVASSLGKTFSMTGWKIGWTLAPEHLTAGIRSAHQFLTFATATPLQHAAAAAIRDSGGYIEELVASYRRKRDFLCAALLGLGFDVFSPAGTYFIMADHRRFGFEDDVAFCRHLATEVGVAAIPPTAFYERTELGRSLVRFAFCKRDATLEEAVRRMEKLKPVSSGACDDR